MIYESEFCLTARHGHEHGYSEDGLKVAQGAVMALVPQDIALLHGL